MRTLAADLHIHTALSPCAAAEMTPPAIVRAAEESQLALIAICDHNATGNAAAVQAAAGDRLAVLAGMEIATAEEVHVVGVFPNAEAAASAGDAVRQTLPEADDAYYQRFGPQYLMDADGAVTGRESKMLAMCSTLPLTAAVELIRRHGGLAIAAHVNRPSFSVLSQLGMFPVEAGFDAIEVFQPCDPSAAARRPSALPAHVPPLDSYGLPVLASSDAHYLADIGRGCSVLRAQRPSFTELAFAFRGTGGRGVHYA